MDLYWSESELKVAKTIGIKKIETVTKASATLFCNLMMLNIHLLKIETSKVDERIRRGVVMSNTMELKTKEEMFGTINKYEHTAAMSATAINEV